MKVTLCAAFFVAALAVVAAKGCTDSDECGEKECCAGYTPFRGTCRKMTKEGKLCKVEASVFPFNDIYILSCPCEEGFECVGKVKKNGKVSSDGTCQVPPTEGSSEETTTEAGSDETTTAGGSEETTTEAGSDETTTAGSEETTDNSAETTVDEASQETKSESGSQENSEA